MAKNLGDAILEFDKKMTSEDPGDLDKTLLELVNLIMHLNRVEQLPDDAKSIIISKLNSLVEEAFPDYKNEVITEAAAGEGGAGAST